MNGPSSSRLRIALLGGSGLLGGAFRRAWEADARVELREFARADLNLTNPDLIDRALGEADFDVLINCAAYTAVDDCEYQGELAQAVNASAPGQLAQICARRAARMIHFSTDYVFSGSKADPYTEEDEPAPLSVYGKSKLDGERLVRDASSNHLVVRLAWLFGPGKPAFPEWIIGEASRRTEVRVVADKTGSPTFSSDVPGWLAPFIFGGADAGGLLHLCNQPPVSWIDWGRCVLKAAHEAGTPLLISDPAPVSLEELPGLTARRPLQSALSTEKFTKLTGVRPRPWQEAITEHLASR